MKGCGIFLAGFFVALVLGCGGFLLVAVSAINGVPTKQAEQIKPVVAKQDDHPEEITFDNIQGDSVHRSPSSKDGRGQVKNPNDGRLKENKAAGVTIHRRR